MDPTSLHICLITDSNYLELTKLCISEILYTKDPATDITLYVIGNNVNLKDLHKFQKVPGVHIVTSSGDFDKALNIKIQYRYLSSTMYLRMFIPTLPVFQNVDKVLYLDSDAFARKDLSNYFNTDIHDVALGVIKDFGCACVFNHAPVDLNTYQYFYSGQLLMNLPYLRKMKFTESCLGLLHQKTVPDQDIINSVTQGHVRYLDPKYCFSWHKLSQHGGNYTRIDLWNQVYQTDYKSIDELTDASVIWHFHGDKNKQRQHPVLSKFYQSLYNHMNQYLGEPS